MNEEQFDKLAGQIRGLEDVIIALGCALEMNGSIDGPKFTDYLNQFADQYRPKTDDERLTERSEFAQRTVRGIVASLEDARANRHRQ